MRFAFDSIVETRVRTSTRSCTEVEKADSAALLLLTVFVMLAVALPVLRVTGLVAWSWALVFAPFTIAGIAFSGVQFAPKPHIVAGLRTALDHDRFEHAHQLQRIEAELEGLQASIEILAAERHALEDALFAGQDDDEA